MSTSNQLLKITARRGNSTNTNRKAYLATPLASKSPHLYSQPVFPYLFLNFTHLK